MKELVVSFNGFWRHHPALLYGTAFLLGIFSALQWHPVLLIPIFLLALSAFNFEKASLLRLAAASLFFVVAVGYFKTNYLFPPNALKEELETGIKGTAHISISSITQRRSYFSKSWIYQGSIISFTAEKHPRQTALVRNIPYRLHLPDHPNLSRPKANQDYVVQILLKQSPTGSFSIKPLKKTPWIPIEGSWSLAETRYRTKKAFISIIKEHYANPTIATFLAGIASGDFDDLLLSFEFSRFGLQHIMAISGFHFAIIAAILSLLLKPFLSQKGAASVLIVLLTGYFIFLGPGPSIMRAWITATIFFMGKLMERRSVALNSLGFALLAILILDPLLCQQIGFQFSFMATAAILLFFKDTDTVLQPLIQKRPLSQMAEMNGMNQHAYLLLGTFRGAVALTLAVHLLTLPMMLFHFSKFPAMSLLYNLFFPFMVSISMLLLILALLLGMLIPPLGELLHLLNGSYTKFMLDFLFNTPTTLDFCWRAEPFSSGWLVGYLSVVVGAGIYLRGKMLRRREELCDIAYL